MANSADAIDLPSDAELRHLESDPARGEGSVGRMGEIGTDGERARAGVRNDEARMTNDEGSPNAQMTNL